MKIAVFDIGTNSIHMLIVEVQKDLSFEVLGHEKDQTRLGDGSFEKKKLSNEAIERALGVLDRFTKIADANGVKRRIAVATSAVRDADNGPEFVAAVYRRTGLRVRVISGKEEGRLIFLAACSGVQTHGKKALVIDIGGGSVEVVLGTHKKISYNQSFKLGVARLTDHFIRRDPPAGKELKKLEKAVRKELTKPGKKIRKLGFGLVIGTGGTMINLASLAFQNRTKKPLLLVNQLEVPLKDVDKAHRKLVRLDWKGRLKMPGLDPKRADIIIAGSTLARALGKTIGFKRLTVSAKGIREGMILDFIEKNRTDLKKSDGPPDIREKSVRQLARRCETDESHCEQVARLSLELFDQTRQLHKLDEGDRELLKYAALLHDIGHYVSFKKHHKHTYYLIVNSDLDGLSPEEVETIGLVARSHRKPISKKIEKLHSNRMRFRTRVLGALLRVADGLDRSHSAVVKSLRCRIRPESLVIEVSASGPADLELWQARERADLFQKVFRRKIRVQLVEKD